MDIARARGWRPPDKTGPKKKTPLSSPRKRREKEQSPPYIAPPAEGKKTEFRPKANPTRAKFYEAARVLYVEEGYSCKQIHDKLKIHRETARRWAQDGQWENQRAIKQQGPQALVVDLEIALRKYVDDLSADIRAGNRPRKGSADEINKLVNVIERLRGDAYFAGHLTKTLELLTDYLRVSDKNELLKIVAEMFPGFTVWALSRKT